ncbi:hypothetical protein C6W18_18275 [Bacillus sp. LLTC93]|nr:hypothetical protein C6W18_18275 [Bacillus sp. LLTC93]
MRPNKKSLCEKGFQRVDKPSHSVSVLRAGAHESQIRSAPILVLPFSITLKKADKGNNDHFSPFFMHQTHSVLAA